MKATSKGKTRWSIDLISVAIEISIAIFILAMAGSVVAWPVRRW